METLGHKMNDPGVINPECPIDILDYAGLYSGPAQWLYSGQINHSLLIIIIIIFIIIILIIIALALLPSPHDDDDWNK